MYEICDTAQQSPAKEDAHQETPESAIPPHKFVLRLAAVSTSEDAEVLAEQILVQRGKNLVVDAGDVERFDTPCVEVLIAASRLWSSDGFSIELGSISQSFENGLETLGIGKYNLEAGEK